MRRPGVAKGGVQPQPGVSHHPNAVPKKTNAPSQSTIEPSYNQNVQLFGGHIGW